jgi:hypothetical protein
LRELDSILTDMTLICQKTTLFERFIASRSELNEVEEKTNELAASNISSKHIVEPPMAVRKSLFEMVTFFITMQDYYMKQSVQKALLMDQKETDSLTSSCVDDVFFILKSSARRALSTFEPSIITGTLSSIGMCLDQEYLSFLTNKLHLSAGSIEHKEGRLAFMVSFNIH